MSNPQLQSNAASALLATINESPNTQHNSYVYSETDAIVPQTSMAWDNLTKSSGESNSLGSLHWDINKNGRMTKMVLGLRFALKATEASAMGPNWAMNCIHEINISSGGRIIQRLTRENILAHISEQPFYVQGAYVDGCHLKAGVTTTANGTVNKDFYLNIPGFWERNKTSLNTSFLQPLRVTVRFADFTKTHLSTTSIELIDDHSILYVQYRNMQDPIDSATIQSNFGDGLLSQLVTTYSAENPVAFTPVDADEHSYPVQLRETSCVQSMYIMVTKDIGTSPGTTGVGVPLAINNIEFSSNGNSYINVPAKMLQLYGTQSVHGDKGFGAANWGETNSTENGGCKYVYKIDFGQGSTDRNILTNLLSFRELASPTVAIKFKGSTDPHTFFVCYKRSELSNTVSSNGRYAIALSN